MLPRIEEKFQGWRALAVLADGGERLLCVGHSNAQVRAGYEAVSDLHATPLAPDRLLEHAGAALTQARAGNGERIRAYQE